MDLKKNFIKFFFDALFANIFKVKTEDVLAIPIVGQITIFNEYYFKTDLIAGSWVVHIKVIFF